MNRDQTNAQPPWNPADKATSLHTWAEWLHDEAKQVFLKDGTHGQMLFLFDDKGPASINPVPPNTSPEQLTAGVRQAVEEHDLYGVITIAEAWVYIPKKPRDHTAFQLLDGEMTVADLHEGDRAEALMVRMESRHDHACWVDLIVRDGKDVSLGHGAFMPKEKCVTFRSYFK